jgi:hypothetical protein
MGASSVAYRGSRAAARNFARARQPLFWDGDCQDWKPFPLYSSPQALAPVVGRSAAVLLTSYDFSLVFFLFAGLVGAFTSLCLLFDFSSASSIDFSFSQFLVAIFTFSHDSSTYTPSTEDYVISSSLLFSSLLTPVALAFFVLFFVRYTADIQTAFFLQTIRSDHTLLLLPSVSEDLPLDKVLLSFSYFGPVASVSQPVRYTGPSLRSVALCRQLSAMLQRNAVLERERRSYRHQHYTRQLRSNIALRQPRATRPSGAIAPRQPRHSHDAVSSGASHRHSYTAANARLQTELERAIAEANAWAALISADAKLAHNISPPPQLTDLRPTFIARFVAWARRLFGAGMHSHELPASCLPEAFSAAFAPRPRPVFITFMRRESAMAALRVLGPHGLSPRRFRRWNAATLPLVPSGSCRIGYPPQASDARWERLEQSRLRIALRSIPAIIGFLALSATYGAMVYYAIHEVSLAVNDDGGRCALPPLTLSYQTCRRATSLLFALAFAVIEWGIRACGMFVVRLASRDIVEEEILSYLVQVVPFSLYLVAFHLAGIFSLGSNYPAYNVLLRPLVTAMNTTQGVASTVQLIAGPRAVMYARAVIARLFSQTLVTQADYNRRYTPPRLSLSLYYVRLSRIVAIGCVFGPGMPSLWLVEFVFFLMQYFMVRYNMLRVQSKPAKHPPVLAFTVCRVLNVLALYSSLHLAFIVGLSSPWASSPRIALWISGASGALAACLLGAVLFPTAQFTILCRIMNIAPKKRAFWGTSPAETLTAPDEAVEQLYSPAAPRARFALPREEVATALAHRTLRPRAASRLSQASVTPRSRSSPRTGEMKF